ncbi:putative ABC transport system ATP-binding protein [Rhizobium sp. BK313]|uniref:ABC transporter ATP-binding protein n=1 Tax=Rhizobium sp. BK313 TaxID=2587081 RepID=UPI001060627D|nr:ABC transporter ATP-binding protein [Rhizobium sp. BK313]MBB3455086.1 putative ABC transport system ATP-binding protein [Rhizobium sp. BK313]
MVLSLRGVSKHYDTAEGPLAVLSDIDLDLAAGSSLALTGESGSGKSTLLHLAGGLDKPDHGQIVVAGQAVSEMDDRGRAAVRRGVVGLVFQQFNLIPSLDVAANLSFHARLAERSDPAWEAELADRLGLLPLMRRYPEQLSGGQQQRVAIGRTLATRPALILADEPTGNLDEANGDTVMTLMLELIAETDSALLMVTHSTRLAGRLDRQVKLTQGRIVL